MPRKHGQRKEEISLELISFEEDGRRTCDHMEVRRQAEVEHEDSYESNTCRNRHRIRGPKKLPKK